MLLVQYPEPSLKLNILVPGENDEDHLDNLDKVFAVLEEMGATVNKKKCKFFASEVEYVGFIDRNAIRTDPKKVEAIHMIPEPKCVKELQSFGAGINYYARFIPNMADIVKPLYKLLEKETVWEWTNEVQVAFKKLKACLSDSPIRGMYQLNLPLILACDASNYGVEAVISHMYPE